MRRIAAIFGTAVLGFVLAGCDQLATVRFYNLTDEPIALRFRAGAPSPAAGSPSYKVPPHQSRRFVANLVLEEPVAISAGGCDYVYRPILRSEKGFGAVWDVQHQLEIRPDLSVNLRGKRGLEGLPNWPLKPLSKNCR